MNTMLHPWQLLIVALAGWLNRQQQAVVEYHYSTTTSADDWP